MAQKKRSRAGRLVEDFGIYAIGSLFAKLAMLVLIPLLTHALSVEQIGLADLVAVTAQLLTPILALSIHEATLRFTMDIHHPPNRVLWNSLTLTAAAGAVVIVCMVSLALVGYWWNLLPLLVLLTSGQMFVLVFEQFARARGESKKFALGGILQATTVLVVSLVLTIGIGMGAAGLLLGFASGPWLGVTYYIFVLRIWRFPFEGVSIDLTGQLLRYSVPAVPAAIMWWSMNAVSRWYVQGLSGAHDVGLYAVASKLPAALTVLTNVFSQAWQVSANAELKEDGAARFFIAAYSIFQVAVFSVCLIVGSQVKPIFRHLLGAGYYDGWSIAPILLGSAALSMCTLLLSGLLRANYDTRSPMVAMLLGGAVTLASSPALVIWLGPEGAALGSLFGFTLSWILLLRRVRRELDLHVRYFPTVLGLGLLAAQYTLFFADLSWLLDSVVSMLLLSAYLLIGFAGDALPRRAIQRRISESYWRTSRVD